MAETTRKGTRLGLVALAAAPVLLGIVMVSVRLRQEEFQREIDSLRREAHAI